MNLAASLLALLPQNLPPSPPSLSLLPWAWQHPVLTARSAHSSFTATGPLSPRLCVHLWVSFLCSQRGSQHFPWGDRQGRLKDFHNLLFSLQTIHAMDNMLQILLVNSRTSSSKELWNILEVCLLHISAPRVLFDRVTALCIGTTWAVAEACKGPQQQ